MTATPAVRPIDYPEPPLDDIPPGPNARQALAHDLAPHADELLFGGARGGGKTDFALAECLRMSLAVPGHQSVIFRRTYKELSGSGGAIPRLLARGIPRGVARWNGTDRVWRFYNGSVLALSYLESLADVQAWLGLEIQLMVFDQLEQIDEPTYLLVRSSLRVAGQTARAMLDLGLRPRSIATANPGGRGHAWVKSRFVDPVDPQGTGLLFRAKPTDDEPVPMVRCFVRSLLADNPALDRGDPSYRAKLEALQTDDRQAMLEGDWNVYKGARFGDFRTETHVLPADRFTLPPHGTAPRAVGVDYGSDHPFTAYWGVLLADDLLVVYREVWARRLTPAEQARLILASEQPGERSDRAVLPTALDPSCWSAPPTVPRPPGRLRGAAAGPPDGSIAWHYRHAGVNVERADNRRIEGAADIAGRLKVRPDGMPRILILDTCPKLIETLPSLQRAKANPEDVEKANGDDWYDGLRYMVMRIRTAGFAGPEPPQGRPPVDRPPEGVDHLAKPAPAPVVSSGVRKRGF